MRPRPEPCCGPRRSALAALAGLASLLLAGCAPLPTDPPGAGLPLAPAAPFQPLRELGFQPSEEGWLLDLGAQAQFEFGSDSLPTEALLKLHRIGRALLPLPIERLRVEGHADEVGSDAYNLQLSERRAQAVARVLQAAGLRPERLQVQGFGKRRPIASNQTDQGRAQNRRVVLIVPASR